MWLDLILLFFYYYCFKIIIEIATASIHYRKTSLNDFLGGRVNRPRILACKRHCYSSLIYVILISSHCLPILFEIARLQIYYLPFVIQLHN